MTAQSMVIAKHSETNKTKNSANAFKWAIWLFLESLVGLKQSSHSSTSWIKKKPAMMPYCHIEHCFHQLLLYRCRIIFAMHTQLLWTTWELVEQLFLAQSKAHQAKYAKISEMSSNMKCQATWWQALNPLWRLPSWGDHHRHVSNTLTSTAAYCMSKKDKVIVWHRPRIYLAWNRHAWELPGPIKIKSCMVRGSNPGPAKYCDRVNGDVQNNVIM